MGGKSKLLIKNCQGSFGREEKGEFLRALKAPQFEYSHAFEEKLHNMLRMGDSEYFSVHHRTLVSLARENPSNLQYILNIYFSCDKSVLGRASRVLREAWFSLGNNDAVPRFAASRLLVEAKLQSGEMAPDDITLAFAFDYGEQEKMPDFDKSLDQYLRYCDEQASEREHVHNRAAGFVTEEAMRKVVSEIKSGNPERLKRAVELLQYLPLEDGLVSDACVLELFSQFKPLHETISSLVKEMNNRMAKERPDIWRNDDAAWRALGKYWDIEEDIGKIVSHLGHEYEKRTGTAPAIDATRQLPPCSQKFLEAMVPQGEKNK